MVENRGQNKTTTTNECILLGGITIIRSTVKWLKIELDIQ